MSSDHGYHILPFRLVVRRSGRKALTRVRTGVGLRLPNRVHRNRHQIPTSTGVSPSQSSFRRLRRTTCWTQDVVSVAMRVLQIIAIVVILLATSAPATAQDTTLTRERYVPADQLDVIFERTPNGVMLPKEEFDVLLQDASDAASQHKDIPAKVAIKQATYAVRQVDNHAVVNLTLDVEQFVDDWQTLTIPAGHLLLEEATIGDEPAAVGRHPQRADAITLLHRQSGQFTLKLKLSTPLGTVGSDRVAAFNVLPNTVATLLVEASEKQHVEVNQLQLERPANDNQPATYKVPVGSTNDVRIRWTSGRQQAETETLVFARTDANVRLSVDTLRWNSDTRITVYGSPINQVIAKVPARLEVTSVDSTGLESWTLEDDPEEAGFTRVILSYRQPFSNDRVVHITGVAVLKTGKAADIPTLQFVNVTAHAGRLKVTHEGQLRLRAEVGSGIRQLSASEFPMNATASGASVFDFWLQDYQLQVAVRPRDQELFSQVSSALSIVDTIGSLQVDLTVETLNEPLFEVELTLPEGWQLTQVVATDGRPIDWRTISEGEDGNALQIAVEPATPVATGQLLPITVNLRRSIPDPATPQTLPLPVVTAPATTVVAGSYQVASAPDLNVAPVEIQGLVPVAGTDNVLLFETQGTTFSGQLSVERKPVRIASRAELRTWADSRQETILATVTIDVTNGTTRTLQLVVPEDAGADLRFDVVAVGAVAGYEEQQVPTGLAIVEQSPVEPADGQRAYNLTFDRRFSGSVTLRTLINNDRTAGDPIAAPFVKVPDAVRQHGLLVFEASPEQQFSTDNGATIGLMPAHAGLVDAPAESTGRRVARVYRFVQPDYSLTVNEVRFDTQAVPSAVCEQIENVSLLSDTGSIQRSATVHLRCVGIQTLRFSLPDDAFLWSTVLNGEAIEVRQDTLSGDTRDEDGEGAGSGATAPSVQPGDTVHSAGVDYLVAIPTDSDGNEHTLEILFESSGSDVSRFGATTQESISLSIDTEQGTAQPIVILEQTWDVRYPDDALLLDHNGAFHPLNGTDQPGWLQAIGSGFRMPVARSVIGKVVPLIVFVLVLFVVTAAAINRRMRPLTTVVAILLLLVIIPALILPTINGVYRSARVSTADRAAMEAEIQAAASEPAGSEAPTGLPSPEYLRDDVQFHAPTEMMRENNAVFEQAENLAKQSNRQAGQQSGSQPGEPEMAPTHSRSGADQDGLSFGSRQLTFPGQAGAGDSGGYGRGDYGGTGLGGYPGGGMGGGGFGGGGGPFGGAVSGSVGVDTTLGMTQAPQPQSPDARPSAGTDVVFSRTPQKSGTARLSVRVDLQTPEDYRSTEFRSIGTTNGAGELDIVIQNRHQLTATRWLTAFIIVLLCWRLAGRSWISRLTILATVTLLAIAIVPLLPNQWQAVADGVVLGAALSLVLWLVFAACRCFESWVEGLRGKVGSERVGAT